jgi:hypothetical protein
VVQLLLLAMTVTEAAGSFRWLVVKQVFGGCAAPAEHACCGTSSSRVKNVFVVVHVRRRVELRLQELALKASGDLAPALRLARQFGPVTVVRLFVEIEKKIIMKIKSEKNTSSTS